MCARVGPKFLGPRRPHLLPSPLSQPHQFIRLVLPPKNIRLNSWHVVIKASVSLRLVVCVCVSVWEFRRRGRGTSSSFKRSKIRPTDYGLEHSKKIGGFLLRNI